MKLHVNGSPSVWGVAPTKVNQLRKQFEQIAVAEKHKVVWGQDGPPAEQAVAEDIFRRVSL
jgi:hypothetical protein